MYVYTCIHIVEEFIKDNVVTVTNSFIVCLQQPC